MKRIATLSSIILTTISLHSNAIAENDEQPVKRIQTIELPEDIQTKRSHDENNSKISQDKYLEAYIQGLLDAKFPKNKVTITVRNGDVLLANLPDDKQLADCIVNFVKKFSSVATAAGFSTDIAASEMASTPTAGNSDDLAIPGTGIWLPQSTVLFPTMVANPRQISFSVGQRLRDQLGKQRASAVSFGDQLPLYRWCNMWKWHGDLQLELEAGVFAVFNHTIPSAPLLNADYYVGIPLSYAIGPYAFRLRLYHISSHLGDELKHVHRHVHRRNKSFEALDFFTSYNITEQIRVYGGVGVIGHSDSEMRLKPLYVEYGAEVRPWRRHFKQLYGQPFLAMHFANRQDTKWKADATFAVGYEWGKIQGFGRKLRAFIEYHEGFSPDGQFSRQRTDYVAFRLAYGF